MDKREESKIESVKDITGLIEQKKQELANLPAVLEIQQELNALVADAQSRQGVIADSTTGKTGAKNLKRQAVTDEALLVAGAVYNYGIDNKDKEAEEIGSISASDFRNMREADVNVKALNIFDVGVKLGEKLNKYGVSTTELKQLKHSIDDYDVKKIEKGAGQVNRSTARDTMDVVFEKINIQLEKLDKLMARFENKNPELFNAYTNARNIKDKATRKREKDNGETKPDAAKL